MTLPLSKRWAGVLVASLAINLFLIGAVVAGLAMRDHGGPFRPPPPAFQGGLSSFSMPFAIRALGDEVRPLARETFRKHRSEFRSNRQALAEGREQALRLLSSANYRQSSFREALNSLQQRETRARSAVYSSIVELTEKLTPDQRGRLAGAIRDREQRRIKFIREKRRRVRGAGGKFGKRDGR